MKLESNKILQGLFPGGQPHRSVLFREDIFKPRYGAHFLPQKKKKVTQGFIQTYGSGNAFKVDPGRLNLNNTGVPLPNNVLKKMESVFNENFAGVRIHTGGYQAESVGALAFTTGNDIYFAQGQYNPNSIHGQRLIGHELTHVVQQRNGRVKNPFGSGVAVVNDLGLEAEAERMGLRTAALQSKSNPSSFNQKIIYNPVNFSKILQRTKGTLKTKWNKSNGTYIIDGRPDFDSRVKSDLYETADDLGENYIVTHSTNDGKSFTLPTIHRRHRVAWDLWKRSLNKALEDDERYDFNKIIELAKLHSSWEMDKYDWYKVRDEGKYLTEVADKIFNQSWNIWLGPGDENIAKGAKITKALNNLISKPKSKTFYNEAVYSTSDPRNTSGYSWDDNSLSWGGTPIPSGNLTPTTIHGMDVVDELLYHQTNSKYANRNRGSNWNWD